MAIRRHPLPSLDNEPQRSPRPRPRGPYKYEWLSRWRIVRPDDAWTGLAPHNAAKDASVRMHSGLSPAATNRAAAVFGLSAFYGRAKVKRGYPGRIEPSPLPSSAFTAERVVVGIAMPPRFTLEGDGGPCHDFGWLGGEEATLNDKIVVGGLVVAVLDKRHQGDSAHGPGSRLPGHIAFHGVIHSDHFPNDVPNTLEVVLRQAGRARNLVGFPFEHVSDEAIQVDFRIVGDCHGLGAQPRYLNWEGSNELTTPLALMGGGIRWPSKGWVLGAEHTTRVRPLPKCGVLPV